MATILRYFSLMISKYISSIQNVVNGNICFWSLEGILYRRIEDYQKNGYPTVYPQNLWDDRLLTVYPQH